MGSEFRSPAHALGFLAGRNSAWQPHADVYRTRDGWIIKFELAGVRPEEVQVAVHGNRLVLSGQRRDVRLEQTQQSHSLEISYNRFERSIELPCQLESVHISTDYRDGMLIVRLAMREPS